MFRSWMERNVKFQSVIVLSFASEFFWQLASLNKSFKLISTFAVL